MKLSCRMLCSLHLGTAVAARRVWLRREGESTVAEEVKKGDDDDDDDDDLDAPSKPISRSLQSKTLQVDAEQTLLEV